MDIRVIEDGNIHRYIFMYRMKIDGWIERWFGDTYSESSFNQQAIQAIDQT